MAEDTYKEDKTESATGKRRGEIREKGNVAQSQEVYTAVSILMALLALYVLAPWMLVQLKLNMKMRFADIVSFRISPSNIVSFCVLNIFMYLKIVAPLMLVLIIAGFVGGYIQFGWLWTFTPLKPKLSSIKPKFSAINVFKKDKIVDLLVAVAKLSVVCAVAYFTIKGEIEKFVPLMDASVKDIVAFIALFSFKVLFRVSLILALIALIDFIYKKWKHEQDIKMTKQEVKDEKKNIEGDPLIKSAIRRRQLETALKRMFAEVPKADVVITNPVHLAIALQYEVKKMNAPKVLAKGKRLIAERIKEVAREHGIPVVENKSLAQAMYDAVEVGMEIPIEFYKAVAKVLAEIYKAGKNRSKVFS